MKWETAVQYNEIAENDNDYDGFSSSFQSSIWKRISERKGKAMADKVEIGAFLAKLRKEKKLTQAELAEMLHVSNKTVSRWETGVVMPGYTDLMALCSLYGIELQELLSGKRKEVNPPETVPEEQIVIEEEPESVVEEEEPAPKAEEEVVPPQQKQKKFLYLLLIILAVLCLGLTALSAYLVVNSVSVSDRNSKPKETAAAGQNTKPAAVSNEKKTESAEIRTEQTETGVSAAGEPEQENLPRPVTDIYVEGSGYKIRHSAGDEVINIVTLPEEIAEERLSDEELRDLSTASPASLRNRIGTVADMIRWFNVKNPDIWDSNVTADKEENLYYYLTPEQQLEDGAFSADGISLPAAWLIEDDYEGLCVVYANGKNCMNNMYVCVPIREGWFVFDMAAFTMHGSENSAVDCTIVRELSDLYNIIDRFNETHHEQLDVLSVITDLKTPVVFYEDAYTKHLHEKTSFEELRRKGA